MRREEQVTDFAPVEAVLFSKIAQGVKVTERLAHFFSLNQKMRAVQPVFDEGPAGRAFALGNLVLVMGKNQILAAQMEVKTFSEHFHAHGAALDVPAGPAFTPRTRPEHVAVLRHTRLPEREVRDGFLRVLI